MRSLSTLFCLGVCVFVPACSSGPKPVNVSGKLNYGDKPLQLDDKAGVTVTFIQVMEEGKPAQNYSADIKRDNMSFTVKDRNGAGIPPGKYRITVMMMSPGPLAQEINQRFNKQTDSPLVREITKDESIVLDLSKPDGN